MTRDELKEQLTQVINDAEWDCMERVLALVDRYTEGVYESAYQGGFDEGYDQGSEPSLAERWGIGE